MMSEWIDKLKAKIDGRGWRGSEKVWESTITPMLRDVYADPCLETLRCAAPEMCLLIGRMEITDLELQTALTDEGAFVTLLTARLESTLDEMVERLVAPTFPVHDQPCLASRRSVG